MLCNCVAAMKKVLLLKYMFALLLLIEEVLAKKIAELCFHHSKK
jgi:hypothetical protein